MTFWKWSQTPASNATADSTINWAEGQAPSSVNDSARAMMTAAAKYRDDVSGAITATGTSSAYVVTSNQVFDTLAHLRLSEITFICPATNAAGVTLNVDGLGAQAINGVDGVAIPAGTLISGGVYTVTAYTSEFILHSFQGNPYNLPIGGLLPYTCPTVPNSNFVFPYGQAISRSTYSAYFALVSTTYGVGDNSTTFNILDLRGRVPAGKDDMGGSAASRMTLDNGGITGTTLGAAGGNETQTLTTAQIPSHSHANTLTDPGHTHGVSGGRWGSNASNAGTAGGSGNPLISGANTFITIDGAGTGVSINNVAAGGGGAHTIMQPTIVCNYILRVI